ncbi:electron transfer flavoprotein alpha-subunit, mitochondrial precursor [Trichoderma evansii]
MHATTRTFGARLSSQHCVYYPRWCISRYASTLAVLEVRNGQLSSDSARTVSATSCLKGPVTALLVGGIAKKATEEAAAMKGLNKVVSVAQEPNSDARLAEHASIIIASLAKEGKYTHVVAANSVFSRDAVIRAAALNGHQPISDVTNVDSEDVFIRPIYAGNAIMTVKSTDDVKYLTVRSSAFPPADLADRAVPIETYKEDITSEASPSTKWVREDLVKSDRPDLGTALRVVSGGRGLNGFADNSLQVGQTGNVVAPELYVAVGISGAIQHLAGMKDSKVIAAINKDAEAPIFQVADVGLVEDLFEAVPELTQRLSVE